MSFTAVRPRRYVLPNIKHRSPYPTIDNTLLEAYVDINRKVDGSSAVYERNLYKHWQSISARQDPYEATWDTFNFADPTVSALDGPAFGRMITDFYVRGRSQSTVLALFDELVRRNVISQSALIKPISFAKPTRAVQELLSLLSCFQAVSDSRVFSAKLRELFYQHFHWLAVVIIRGLNPSWTVSDVLDVILETGLFGGLRRGLCDSEFSTEAIKLELTVKEYFWTRKDSSTISRDPEACIGTSDKIPTWGFWLPYHPRSEQYVGQDHIDAFQVGIKLFDAIERCYREWFHLEKQRIVSPQSPAWSLLTRDAPVTRTAVVNAAESLITNLGPRKRPTRTTKRRQPDSMVESSPRNQKKRKQQTLQVLADGVEAATELPNKAGLQGLAPLVTTARTTPSQRKINRPSSTGGNSKDGSRTSTRQDKATSEMLPANSSVVRDFHPQEDLATGPKPKPAKQHKRKHSALGSDELGGQHVTKRR